MRSLTLGISIVVASLLVPATASGITFGEWASAHGYSLGAAMPGTVYAINSNINNLSGIADFDWTTTPTIDLDLRRNQLSGIEAGDFSGLTNLTSLNLFGNQIASIEANGFSALTNLTGLNLRANQLTSIEPGTFSGLTNLTGLNLFGNQIASIEADGFSALTNLTGLGLRDNRLSSIEAGDFSGLTHLTSLNLMENQLTSIGVGTFSDLTNLTDLDLHYNRLTSIDTDTLSGLTNLTYLNLEHNQLSSIEAGDFSGLTNLPSLFLRHNRLSSIEAGDFSGLTNLTSLDLFDNQIASIEADDFSSLTNLTELHLYHNRLASIEAGAFSGMSNLTRLTLGDNSELTELNLAEADFLSLAYFDVAGNYNLTRVSLKNSVLNQDSLVALMDYGCDDHDNSYLGIGWIMGIAHITELDLSGIDFATITDLAPLYVMDDLTDLWLVGTHNFDAFQLDAMLDELATIEGTDVEGILYMTHADFNAFNTAGSGLLAMWHAEDGHHVAFVPEPATVLLLLAGLALAGLRGSRVTSNSLSSRTGTTHQKQTCSKRWLVFGAALVISALLSPMAASGYTFADSAYHRPGYTPGDVMPSTVDASYGNFDSLSGIGLFDWTSTPTLRLDLDHNLLFSVETEAFSGLTNLSNLDLTYNYISRIETDAFSGLANLTDLDLVFNNLSRIETGAFNGLINLTTLYLHYNWLKSIEPGAFSGLTNLKTLGLGSNYLHSLEPGTFSGLTNLERLLLGENPTLTELNLTEADFSSLTRFDLSHNNITNVSLKNAVLNQGSLNTLMDGGASYYTGIGELPGVTELDLSGIDFVDITDLAPLYVMDDLTDLWLVGTQNLDAFALDAMLDELATIEGTAIEGILHMTLTNYNAFNAAGGDLLALWDAEPGHHVAFVVPESAGAVLCGLAALASLACRRRRPLRS